VLLLNTKLYPHLVSTKLLLDQISENCFLVSSNTNSFLAIYDKITQYEMYEGEVLKMKNGKLEDGVREKNNTKTQIKARKETKNYAF